MKKLTLFLILAAFASCKKGDTGAPGSPGTNGSANVQTTYFYNQSFTVLSSPTAYVLNLTVPAITQSVVDKGSVSVYMRQVPDTDGWYAVPTIAAQLDVVYNLQSVHLWSNAYQVPIDVKVVVIPSN